MKKIHDRAGNLITVAESAEDVLAAYERAAAMAPWANLQIISLDDDDSQRTRRTYWDRRSICRDIDQSTPQERAALDAYDIAYALELGFKSRNGEPT